MVDSETVSRNLTNINDDEFIIEIVTDDNGNVVKVLIYVDDEETANIISDNINGIDKSGECRYGVLCRTTRTVITKIERNVIISNSHHVKMSIICLIVILIIKLEIY